MRAIGRDWYVQPLDRPIDALRSIGSAAGIAAVASLVALATGLLAYAYCERFL